MSREPESEAAREVFDAIIEAKVRGEVSQEAVNWTGSKAFEQFRKDARKQVEAERERDDARRAAATKQSRRNFWAEVFGK